jgi:hypothetical protein
MNMALGTYKEFAKKNSYYIQGAKVEDIFWRTWDLKACIYDFNSNIEKIFPKVTYCKSIRDLKPITKDEISIVFFTSLSMGEKIHIFEGFRVEGESLESNLQIMLKLGYYMKEGGELSGTTISNQTEQILRKILFPDDNEKECGICMESHKNINIRTMCPNCSFDMCLKCSVGVTNCPVCRCKVKKNDIK